MKKNPKKLVINKETLKTLTRPALKEAMGGVELHDGIVWTGCMSECTEC